MTQTVGIQGVKYDPLVAQLPVDVDQQQSIDLRYKIDNRDDIRQIKRVYGSCIEIKYPIERADPIEAIRLIESQFAKHNMIDNLDDKMIDQAIDNLTRTYLEHDGLELPDDQILEARVRALIIKQVRGISSTEELIDYLESNTDTAELVGLNLGKSDLSTSTFSRVRREFNINSRLAERSVNRIRRTLFRNGIFFDKLSNTGFGSHLAIPQDSKLPDRLRYQALVNWSELLLRQLTDGISFNRATNVKYTTREIIASLAVIATHENFNKGRNLAQLRYQDDIITHTRLKQIIHQNICDGNFFESKHTIESIGNKLNRNLLQFAADELGFFSTPLDVALDPTWVSVENNTDPEAVQGAMGNTKIENDGGHQFVTGTSCTPMSRFSLGVKLTTDKSELQETFRQMLLFLSDFADIGWILADREFDNPETVELFRYMADKKWIIRLRDNKNLISNDERKKLKRNGKAVMSFGGTEINAFWKELDKPSIDWLGEKNDNKFIVLSGIPIDETSISELESIYSKRWGVETHIRELKHALTVPLSFNSALERLLIFNISSVFYNMYKIINQSLSPSYGLPIQPKYYEVLLAIADATFQRHSQLRLGVNTQ